MSFTVNLSGGGLLINRFNSSNMLKSTQEGSDGYICQRRYRECKN